MNLFDLLLIVAVVLFVLSIVKPIGRGWMVPIGLACFAGAFLLRGVTLG